MKKFRTWPAPLRVVAYALAGVVALTLATGMIAASVSANTAGPRHAAAVTRCTADYDSSAARTACIAGNVVEARATEKTYKAQLAHTSLVDQCANQYDSAIAAADCVNGDTAGADAAQKQADAVAAAAQKKATEGQSYDNPYPVGTEASMTSTNRIDGSTVTYSEWISGFNANWTGYDEFDAPDPGKKYIAFVVNVKATDAGVDAGTVGYDTSFTDSAGNAYSAATAEYEASPQMPQVTLGAGQQASGIVVFEVPTSVNSGVATFGDGSVFEALQ